MAQKAAIPVPALVQWRTRRCWLPAGSRSFCFRPWGLEIQAANASITIRQQDMPFLLGNAAACRKSPSAAAFSSRVRFPLLANIGAVRWPRAALAFARVCGVDGETDQASAPLMRSAVSKSRLWKRRRGFVLPSEGCEFLARVPSSTSKKSGCAGLFSMRSASCKGPKQA